MRIPSTRRYKRNMEKMGDWGHDEGQLTTAIEDQTAKLPSDFFLFLAGGAVLTSLTLRAMDRKEDALFVGEWAPTFLILGLYNKLVKLLGHD